MNTALATLPDIDTIEAGFNKAMDLYTAAFAKIADADRAIKSAYAAIEEVTPGAAFHSQSDARELKEFNDAVQLPDKNVYLSVARKLLNLRCWHYVVDRCGMRQLMDAQAKRELDEQLRYVAERPKGRRELITDDDASKGAPPFTSENVRATMIRFAGEADTIWRRGIANVFSDLDRRFRSHDGFKVGGRIILNHFVESGGYIRTYGASADRFRDIERTFKILDGRDPRLARSDFLYTVEEERKKLGLGWRPGQSVHENEFFRVRVYQNGNAHLWFCRDDLVEKVNKELAAYYGEVIGDAKQKEADPLENRDIAPARLFGFYPTPPDLARGVAAYIPRSDTPLRILEPSAGTGNLAFASVAPHEIVTRNEWCDETNKRIRETKKISHVVDAIELQPTLATALRNSGKIRRVTTADFLQFRPDPNALYDGVIMNPPFDNDADVVHVSHALKFLKPDGWLLTIMSAGTEFRETARAAAFRKTLDARKGWMLDLPAGSFSSVGTHVNTVLVGIGLGSKPWRFEV
jgi:predicted RNA methylase